MPGPIREVTVTPDLTSVQFSWSAPQLPNGVLLSYEMSYRVADPSSDLIMANTTNISREFEVTSLVPFTDLHDVTISAYTVEGRGESVEVNASTLSRELEE